MDIPRRAILERMTDAEKAIRDVIQVVEAVGCDVRLTDAVILLSCAKDSVSDYVDGIERRRTVEITDGLEVSSTGEEINRLKAALKAVTDDMDRAGSDSYGMPECPWCWRGPDGDEHNADCELLAARALLAGDGHPQPKDLKGGGIVEIP